MAEGIDGPHWIAAATKESTEIDAFSWPAFDVVAGVEFLMMAADEELWWADPDFAEELGIDPLSLPGIQERLKYMNGSPIEIVDRWRKENHCHSIWDELT